MLLQFWINCASLLYIVPTYALYIFQLYIIYFSTARNRFVSSFYFIYGATVINDITAHLTYIINYRFLYTMDGVDALARSVGHHWFYTIFLITMFHTFYGHSFFILALSINRYTILAMKAKYASFWDSRRTLIIMFIACVPFVLTSPIIFDGNGGILMRPAINNTGYIIVEDANHNLIHNKGLHAATVQLVCIVICFVLNFTVSYQLWKRTQQNISQGVARFGSRTHKAEAMLFLYSLLCMLLEIFVFITQVAFAFASSRKYGRATITLLSIQQYVMDVQYLFPAWFMFMASGQMKKEMIARLPCSSRLNVVFNVNTSVTVKTQVSRYPSGGPPSFQMQNGNSSHHHLSAL